jgi:SAM-dependent methyltransferase
MLSFGKETVATYDDSLRGDEKETVDLLEQLARGGPVLELAVGTGRIALPLAERGLEIHGIDFSPEMVEQLRAKPGGDRIRVTIGDFAEVPVPGRYRLIYIVFNTFHNLLTQEDQVRCFENVANHLEEDGQFLIEAGLPSEYFGKSEMQYVMAERIEIEEVGLDVAQYDPATQLLTENHVVLTTDGATFFPIVTRYAWPSELDLMARIAGLRLHHRWSGWFREPFAAKSWRHVSVFGR